MKIFHPTQTPLSGTNLIEASAGTGKTYMMTWLFLRLVLEAYIPANQILVVTFTKAATEELKERIRNKLLQAKSAFLKGSCDDTLIDAMVKKHHNPDLAVHIIQDTLIDFDHVPIFTIHGFCQRILHENAFETLNLFDTELVANPFNLTLEVVDDFWRQNVYHMPPELISYTLNQMSAPEYFLKLAAKKTTPDIKIIPRLKEPSIESLGGYRAVFEKLKRAWPESRSEATSGNGGLKDAALSGTIYGSLKPVTEQSNVSKRDLTILSLAEAMDRFVDSKSIGYPLFKNFEKFTATRLSASTNKNKITPTHAFFDICDELYMKSAVLETEMERYHLYLKTQFFTFLESNLSTKKNAGNVQFFDDLLIKVSRALEGSGSDALEAAIRQKYRAALVDEFQDTDALQYGIFTKLFRSKQSILFMIGDPKQAIYGFRGADIFSYMKAARHANSTYTLLENWRSTPGLISAVNTLFSNTHTPFVFDQIRFDKGKPGKKTERVQKQNGASLTLWYLGTEKNTPSRKPVSKTGAESLIAEAVAGEISRLITPDHDRQHDSISRRIKPGDIAVLVRTNRQAQIIQKDLSYKRVPSVLYHTGNIFHTHEAMEMERILFSISEPGNERRFRTALVTDAIGVFGKELDLDTPEPDWWERRLTNFREYYRIWNRYGFIRMFRQFMTKENVRERLLSFPDGERRSTNFLHLTEILHHASLEKKTGMKGLLKWLSEQRSARVPESESHLLRLEKDDEAVKIITMHKSKGLEYRIVFCPFAWNGSFIKDNEIVFHNASQNKELTLDLGSNQKHRHVAYAQNERLAENLRLLYVALTRAIEHCYLVWGRINTAETSALAYLFHYRLNAKDDFKKVDLVPSLSKRFLSKSDKDVWDDLRYLSKASQGAIEIVPMPVDSDMKKVAPPEKEEKVSCRKFSGKIDTDWKVSSYSYLVSQKIPEAEFPDRDRHRYDEWNIHEAREDFIEKTDIFSFPRGVKAGIFFHDLFEHLDFASSNSNHQKTLVDNKLKAYGYSAKWHKPVRSMINNVLSIPIETTNNGRLTLASIQCQDRINEMEFYFPLNPIAPHQLVKIFHAHSGNDVIGFPERIETLAFPVSKGYMKGYIDLVFRHNGRYYIIDWKSNFLGSHVKNYDNEALNQIISREYYFFQYHLYTLALHQYLRLRLPGYRYENDFGGVIYMFIRGIDPAQSHEFGLYKDLPDPKLIHELGRLLIPGYYPK